MITNSIKAIDKERQKIMSKMYVSNVKNRLREMDTPYETDCKRWIWELMQNAKDSISGTDRKEVNIKLEIKENEVVFQHDGCPFNGKTYLALLYKYSEGKSQNIESTGRFGTGFLTTHCLSKTVNIDGPIINKEDGKKEKIIRFNVTMYREGKIDQELINALERMEKEKKFYHDEYTKWTKYTYSLKTDINKKASKLGLENFKLNIVKTMLFNNKFKNAELKTESEMITIKDESMEEEILDKVQIKKFSVYNKDKKLYTLRFIYIKIEHPSEKLTSRFNSERVLHLEACVEINENNEIIYKEDSPCLFCSLPLVGSEKHVLPITLNTNDFEPSTERQEILLNGEETNLEDGKYIVTEVGINKYILDESKKLFQKIVLFCSENNIKKLYRLLRGLKELPKVDKYFDSEWYYENYILPMRDIISEKNIVTKVNGKKEKIRDIYFPIYRKKEDFLSTEERERLKDSREKDEQYKNYLKDYHKFCKLLFKEIPEFDESIHWSEYLWKKGLEENRITINILIDQYQKQNLYLDKINEFIKFIWDYYKDLLKENKILINQNGEFTLYTNDFAEAKDVSDDMVDCLEELGNKWREVHLHNRINSIELPFKHDISYAEKQIREKIKLNPAKSFILAKYINKGDEEHILFHSLIKKIFIGKIGRIKYVNGFNNEIWTESDNYIIKKIIEEVVNWKNIKNLPFYVSNEDFNKILNFLYYKNSNCFKNNKLLPSNNGEFKLVDELKMSEKINANIKKFAKKLEIFIDDIILNEKILIKDLNINKFTLDDLILTLTKELESVELDKNIVSDMLRFIPLKNHPFYHECQDIKNIYSAYFSIEIKPEIIVDTKIESFWQVIKKRIMNYIQLEISEENKISEDDIDNYIEILNQYKKYFDFEKYSLLPNINLELKYKKDLLDYSDIPTDIIDVLSRYDNDFEGEIMHFDLNIEIQKKNISDFSKIMNRIISSIISKRNEQGYSKLIRNYFSFYDSALDEICKTVIKYIPDDDEIRKLQKKIYKVYNLFEDLEEQITITSYETFYKSVNRLIIIFINEKLEKIGNMEEVNEYVGDYIEFVNDNKELLMPNEYAILPNLDGDFKHLKELKKNDGIYTELLEIISNFSHYERFALSSILMNENIKIKEFLPEKSMNNRDISILFNELIKYGKLDPIEIIRILPPKEKQSKQKEIIFIYEKVFDKELKTYELDLDLSFWEEANNAIIIKTIKKIERRSLEEITSDEKTSIEVLEKIYKFINPRTLEGEFYEIVPNQNGKLKLYSDLAEEENISENFKEMMINYFDYDLNDILKHKDITLKFEKKLTINEKIINIIEKGIKNERDEELKLNKAVALIKFYPNIKDNNHIKKFGQCFMILLGEKYQMEQIETNYPTLWNICIPILAEYVLQLLDEDKNIENLCKRINVSEDEIYKVLNDFYSIIEKKKYGYNFIPNENKNFVEKLYVTDDIDSDLKEVLRLLNENEDFSEILLNPKVDRSNWDFPKKFVKDIAIIIDKNMKENYKMFKNDRNNKDFNEENFKKACSIIITQWFPKYYSNKEYIDYFEYTQKKTLEILLDVLSDKEEVENIRESIFQNPFGLIKYLGNYQPQKEQTNNLGVKINDSSFPSNDNDNENDIINLVNSSFSSSDKNENKYEKSLNYIAQAHVYENLIKKNLFKDIIWLNKSEERADDEIFIPSHYYIKDQKINYEIQMTSIKTSKTYYIKVKSSIMPNEKFSLFLSRNQWHNLNSLNNNYIFALVCLKDKMHPEISFVDNNSLEIL